MLSFTARSDSLSNEQVASSRISTGGDGRSAGDRDPLELAAREPQPALAHVRVVAEGEALDELGRAATRAAQRMRSAFGCARRARCAGDGVVEQVVVLKNESDP